MNQNCNFRGLIEEVENTNDVDELKQISKNLIRENLILSRRTNTALKSLENQNTLITYLQDTLVSIMTRSSEQSKEFWAILGSETLRTLDNFIHYQKLILGLTQQNNLGERERDKLEELMSAAYTVPFQNVKDARARCVRFLAKLKDEVPEEVGEENVETEDAVEKESTRAIKFQNGRINTLGRNRKQHYRLLAKRNACRTSRKHAFNKSQSNKPESNGTKNSRRAKLANSEETPQSDIEDVQPKKFSRRRRLKRKAEEINNESGLKSDTENVASVNKTAAAKRAEPTKRLRSTPNDSIFSSINQPVKLKTFDVILNDFMKDPSADNDEYIAQYKQALGDKEEQKICFSKGDEENSNKIVDSTDNDIDCDQTAESDHNSENNDENDNEKNDSTKPHESENNCLEQDSTVSKSIAPDDESVEPLRNALLNGVKGHDVNTRRSGNPHSHR